MFGFKDFFLHKKSQFPEMQYHTTLDYEENVHQAVKT